MHTLKFVSASVLAISGVAGADFVDVYGSFIGAGISVNITQDGQTENAIAGQIGLTLSNSTGVNLDGNWISFCTEAFQNIYIGGSTQTYQVSDVADLPIPGAGMGAVRADAIARMYFAAAGAQFGSDNDYAGAFALAIWEISNDFDGTAGSLDIGAGDFTVNSSLSGATAAYLTLLLSAAANLDGQQAVLIGLGNESYQDQILQVSAVPAPGALALLGVAGIIAGRRRRA
jgi:MYXO-CTERM domain-containing protein